MNNKTRNIECELTIDAEMADVWEAITEASHIVNWFAPYVESQPGPEGFIRLGWRSPDNLDELSILEWEPGRRLKTTWHAAPAGGEPVLLPVEITLDTAEGGTLLRLVQTGFLTDESWDDEYESHARGWNTELRSLRYYLERQFRRTRNLYKRQLRIEGDPAEILDRVFSDDGVFGVERRGLREQEEFQMRLPDGRLTLCRVLYTLGTTDFVFICDALNEGILRFAIETLSDHPELWFWALSWQLAEDQLVRLVEPWFQALERKLAEVREERDR